MNTYDISCAQDAALTAEYEAHLISNDMCPKCKGDLIEVEITETVEPFTMLKCECCGWEQEK